MDDAAWAIRDFGAIGFDLAHILVRGTGQEFKEFARKVVHGSLGPNGERDPLELMLKKSDHALRLPRGLRDVLVAGNGEERIKKILDTDEWTKTLCEIAVSPGRGMDYFFTVTGAREFRAKVKAAVDDLGRRQRDRRLASVACASEWMSSLDLWHSLTKMDNSAGHSFLALKAGAEWDALSERIWASAPHDPFSPRDRRELGLAPLRLPNAAFDESRTLIRIKGKHFEEWTKSLLVRLKSYTFQDRFVDGATEEWVPGVRREILLAMHAVFAELYETPQGSAEALDHLDLDRWLDHLVMWGIYSQSVHARDDKYVYFSVRGAIEFRAMVDRAVNTIAHLQSQKNDEATEEQWLDALKEWQSCTDFAVSARWRFVKDLDVGRIPVWNELAWAGPI